MQQQQQQQQQQQCEVRARMDPEDFPSAPPPKCARCPKYDHSCPRCRLKWSLIDRVELSFYHTWLAQSAAALTDSKGGGSLAVRIPEDTPEKQETHGKEGKDGAFLSTSPDGPAAMWVANDALWEWQPDTVEETAQTGCGQQ